MNEQHAKSVVDLPLAHTRATQMLSAALAARPEMSQRTLAQALSYKSSVVISHMASGRAPIPIERVIDIAEALDMDQGAFLLAVLEQRYQHIAFRELLSIPVEPSSNAASMVDVEALHDLERVAGARLSALEDGKLEIVKEVLSDRDPARRWLTLNELPFVEELRALEPEFRTRGLLPKIRAQLFRAVRWQ